jgi:glutathione S-transferase
MKLVYFPGACSFAPHVALREAGIRFTLVRFDRDTHALEGGGQLEDFNDKGRVPVLVLDDGQRLTEVAVVCQYIADQRPESALAPGAGTMERYRLQEWLNYLATEIHKPYWPLFHGPDAEKPGTKERLEQQFGWVERKLGTRPFLMGERFTVADAYLLTLVNWMRPAGIDPTRWPGLKEYRARLSELPSVRAALEAEGLLKKRGPLV